MKGEDGLVPRLIAALAIGVIALTAGGRTAAAQTSAALRLYWDPVREDNFSAGTSPGEADALAAGYGFVRHEAYLYASSEPGTVPLKLYWSDERGDNFTTATQQGEADAIAAGYRFIRDEGYVYPTARPGTAPLKLYWSDERGDNFTTATQQGEADAMAAGYAFIRVEGYVAEKPVRSDVFIATLNLYQPALSKDDLSDVGQPVPGEPAMAKVDVWEALRGWGRRLFRKADIVFLQEVIHDGHVRFLAQPDVSGLLYSAVMLSQPSDDLAILSRYPLFGVRHVRLPAGNNLLVAKADIEGVRHLLVNAHWSIDRPEDVTSESRRAAAQFTLDLIAAEGLPVLMGGDLNVKSGYGPEPPLPTVPAEYVMLNGGLWDIYKMLAPRPDYCSDKRIDYLFYQGDYEPADFSACLNAWPSDHPLLIARLLPRSGRSVVASHAPVTAVSPAQDELVVTGVAEESILSGRLLSASWTPGSGWQGLHALESTAGSPERFVGSAVADARTFVFWIGTDGWVYHKWRWPNGQWSVSWPVGNSHLAALHGAPGGAVHGVSSRPGELHVFYARPDGRIVYGRRDNAAGGTWPEHGGLLGGMTHPGGHVTAVSRRPGQIDVFTVGVDGRVYTAAWNAQQGWRGWSAVGSLTADPGTYVAAVSRSLDHLDLFVADASGRIMSAAWEPSAGWRGWWHIQGGFTAPGGFVTAVSRSTDQLDIFITAAIDGFVYTAAWNPSAGWGGWWRISDARSRSPIWPVSRSLDKLDVFFVSPEGTVHTAAWEPGRAWGGPWVVAARWDASP